MADTGTDLRAYAPGDIVPPEMFVRQISGQDVLPSLSLERHVHGRQRDSVLAGQPSLSNASCGIPPPCLGDLSIGQLGRTVSLAARDTVRPCSRPVAVPARHQPVSDGMNELPFASRPFQVAGAVVRGVAIKVVDFMLRRRGAKERHSDEPVYEPGCPPLPHIQSHIESSLPVSARAKDMPGAGAARRLSAANTATVADFVPVLEADDGAPLFGRGTLAMHREASLPGVSPRSFAATRGRFAVRIIP